MSTSKELVYIVRDDNGDITAMVHQDMEKRIAVVYKLEAQNAEDIAELMGGTLPISSKIS